jgi:hypothetical protein
VQPFDLSLMLGCAIVVAVLERTRCPIQELLLPGINLVGKNLIALGRIGHRRLFPQCLQRDLRLSAPRQSCVSVLVVNFRSVCCDGTAPNSISQPVPNPGSTSCA